MTHYHDDFEMRWPLIAVPWWSAGISVAIPYIGLGRGSVVEVIEFHAERRAVRGSACYGAAA